MDESKTPDSASVPRPSEPTISKQKSSWPFTFLVTVLVPVVAATLLYQFDSFDPAPLPPDELTRHVITVPARNDHMLRVSEFVGVGNLKAPEDVAYDAKSGVIYTGCADGWISRVTVNDSAADSVVEKWVNTGGRPLGIAFGHNNDLIVADPEKGLLNVTADGVVELLTDEAEGQKFKTTDAVDVAHNGIIYFSDASHKYRLSKANWDILEGKPNGRLLSYDPATKTTKVLVHNLYFANGVVVSPDQNYVIFCETPMRRCGKYHIQGKEKGKVDKFIDYLPGMPDNIRYDGEGQYWIALYRTVEINRDKVGVPLFFGILKWVENHPRERKTTMVLRYFGTGELCRYDITPNSNTNNNAKGHTLEFDIAFRYPFIRKILIIVEKYIGRPHIEKNGGVLAIDLAGNPIAHYYDPGLAMVSSGIKIGNHLYCGSVVLPYIIRLNLKQYPAQATT